LSRRPRGPPSALLPVSDYPHPACHAAQRCRSLTLRVRWTAFSRPLPPSTVRPTAAVAPDGRRERFVSSSAYPPAVLPVLAAASSWQLISSRPRRSASPPPPSFCLARQVPPASPYPLKPLTLRPPVSPRWRYYNPPPHCLPGAISVVGSRPPRQPPGGFFSFRISMTVPCAVTYPPFHPSLYLPGGGCGSF